MIPEFETPGEAIAYFKRVGAGGFSEEEREKIEVFLRMYKEEYADPKEAKPIYFFRPNLPQSKLCYSLNGKGQMPRILMLEGSNKSGKSTLGVAWQISMAAGFFPWLENKGGDWHFDFHPDWKTHREIIKYCGYKGYNDVAGQFKDIKKLVPKLRVPNENLAVGETYTESVDKDLVPKYMELIPKDWLPNPKKNQQGVINKITLKAGPGKGSVFHFRSYKSTSDEFEGIDISGSVLFNEPPPQDIVTAVNRGCLPFDTRVMFVYTALKEAWLYRSYVNSASRWLI